MLVFDLVLCYLSLEVIASSVSSIKSGEGLDSIVRLGIVFSEGVGRSDIIIDLFIRGFKIVNYLRKILR